MLAGSHKKKEKDGTKKMQKRWTSITTKEGNTYYHNSATGEDQWDKPHDFEALDPASRTDGGGFVKFQNRQKQMLLYEQNKTDAARLGIKFTEPPPKDDMVEKLRASLEATASLGDSKHTETETCAAPAGRESGRKDEPKHLQEEGSEDREQESWNCSVS